MSAQRPLLEIQNLEKFYAQRRSLQDWILRRETEPVQAVDGVSMDLYPNETIGVIGESGCGKTTLIETLAGLHEPTGGSVVFDGEDVGTFDKRDWKRYRQDVQMVFQDPFNSLDPKLTVEETVEEPLKIHGIRNRDERVHDVLEQVELNPPEKYRGRFPQHLSGGEKQRVSIARALIVEPRLLLADEPVSMLDVSTQAAILRLLSDLVEELDLSMVYISHDLSTVSYICHQVCVMYLGRFVEVGPTETILDDPKHPYTQALISAIPVPNPDFDRTRTELPGTPGDPTGIGEGCRFRDRCSEQMDICEEKPLSYPVDDDHHVACHLYYDHREYTDSEEELAAGQIDDMQTPASTASGREKS